MTEQTAKQTYDERRLQTKDKIKELNKMLRQKDAAFKTDQKNWGYAGDLGRINDLLDEIVNPN